MGTARLNTDSLPGPAATKLLYQDGKKRITVVGWLDKNKAWHPAWAAVTLFANNWPDELYWLNELAKQGESIGDLFRSHGFPPLQNRLLKGWLPAAWIPRWAHDEFKDTGPCWGLQVGNFCAEVRDELYEYGMVYEFRPFPYPLPPRSYLGSLAVWRLFRRHSRVAGYLKRTDPPRKWDYLITWIARIIALPAVVKSLRTAHKAF